MAGPLAKKELPGEGYSRRYGKWEESSRQKKMIDNIMINGLYEVRKGRLRRG